MRKGAEGQQEGIRDVEVQRVKRLSPAHQRFVAEYLKDHNGTQAYIRAGYSATPNAAAVAAARLLKNALIREAIAQTEAEILEAAKAETGITLERTLREIGRLAFFDPRQLLHADGSPKDLHDLDEDTAVAIAGLDLQTMREAGEGEGAKAVLAVVRKYKLADKRAALDMLMRHLGGYGEDNKQQGGQLGDLLSQVKRSALPVAQTLPAEDAD